MYLPAGPFCFLLELALAVWEIEKVENFHNSADIGLKLEGFENKDTEQ